MKSAMRVGTLESAFIAATRCTARTAFVPIQQSRHTHNAPRRRLHSSPSSSQTAALSDHTNPPPTTTNASPSLPASALELLPLSQILRTYLITSISSSPILLGASSSLLRRMLESKNFLFSLEKNPIARAILWHTFYKQFCAGTTAEQVNKTCQDLRTQGYGGVILEYALEVLKDAEGNEAEDVAAWRKGMLASIHMALPGDFVGLKWSGMGPAALRLCAAEKPPSPAMDEAMNAVCSAAAAKDIALLPAAEETWNLPGYHSWTLNLQRIYNKSGKSVLYNTYQAYLHQTPGYLAQHLALAKDENFTLGAKLVRGAYLASEPRHLIHPTIESTHKAYDGVMSALINRSFNETVQPASPAQASESWPETNVVLATHNASSVSLAQALRQSQAASSNPLTPLAFAQLQGMADEVSCTLIAAAKASEAAEASSKEVVDGVPGAKADAVMDGKAISSVKERVFKCTTWGSMSECLNYLLRRAAENKDAAGRTADTRKAMGVEIRRRMRAGVGLA